MKLRLFIGLTAPPEWKSAISAFRQKLQPRFSDSFARWTAESNLHLTLRFFGSVEEAEVIAIGERVQKITADTPAFTVTPGPLGCFPNASRPRVIWLGFDGQTDALIQAESRLRTATASFGQPPENRPFHPHLTVARTNEPRRSDRDLLAELVSKGRPIQAPPWQIKELELIRSELKPTGSIYTILATYNLSGRA